jgi:uncharacterized coiled-coil protein SlyX
MTAIMEPTTSAPMVSLRWISRQAEAQVSRLSPVDRARIITALFRPIPRNRCELVKNLSQYRVYHFRASQTLRVSYRPTEQGLCVIHIGTHPEFDRFAQHFAGQSPSNLIPLPESTVMKDYQHAGKNGPANTASSQTHVVPAPQIAKDDEQLLVESLREIIGKTIETRQEALASDWVTRLDGVRKTLEQNCQESGRKIAQQETRLNGLNGLMNECRGKLADLGQNADKLGKCQQELTTLVAQDRSNLQNSCETQGRALEEIQLEVTRHAVQVKVDRNEVEHRMADFNGRLEERSQEFGTRLDAAAESIELQEAANKAWMSRLEGRMSGLEPRLWSLDTGFSDLAKTVQEQQRTITGLQEAMSRISKQLAELTAPRSWRRLLSWARSVRSTPAWRMLQRLWPKRLAGGRLEQHQP